ncbi:hypothetical protein OU640_25320, partial [Escherichia coli]|nr:hypothetical protein [Escherichia coli]
MNNKTPDHQSWVFVCYPQRQIEYTTSATAIAIPTVVNASGQVIVMCSPHLSGYFQHRLRIEGEKQNCRIPNPKALS